MIAPSDLSVIVPAYNAAPYIADCVASIVASAPGCELLVVDDGSSDDTVARLAPHLDAHPQHRLLATPRAGPGGARNRGLDTATRPFVMFVDADDLLLPDGVAALCRAIDADTDFALANRARFWSDRAARTPDRFCVDHAPAPLLSIPGAMQQLGVHGRVYRRTFLAVHEVRFPAGIHWEDVVFSQRVFLYAERVASTARVAYLWRKHPAPRNADGSVMQNVLSAHSLRSRVRQIELSMEIGRSADWRDRFGPGRLTPASEFARVLRTHVRPLLAAARDKQSRAALDADAALTVLAAELAPHRETLRTLRQWPAFEAILAHDLPGLRRWMAQEAARTAASRR